MSYTPVNYQVATAPTLTSVQEHFAGIDNLMADIRRVVRLTGGITNLTLATHSNALIILESGTNQLTSSGADTFPTTVWNRSTNDADILGVTLPNNEIGMTLIDGANNIAEVSQQFSGVVSVTSSLPLSSTGGTTPNISILTNAANGVALFDALNRYPAADGSQITNLTVAPMTGATGVVAGTEGSVPAPAATDNTLFLRGDGTWAAAAGFPVSDTTGIFQDDGDATKQLVLQLANITAGNTRTITAADEDIDLSHVPDIRRVVRVTGGTLALTEADHSNALIIITGGTQVFTSSGAGVFPVTIWNRSTNDATVIGTILPTNEIGMAIIDAGNNIVEISQSFSGLASLTVNAPITDAGTATDPNLSVLTNVANGLVQLDANGNMPSNPFVDTSTIVVDSVDNSKELQFELGGIASGNVRTLTVPDEDVNLGLVREIDLTVEITANTTLTLAAHRNAFLPITVGGVTVTAPAAGSFFATGANFAATDVTVDGVTVGAGQMFTILAFGGNSITKASA